MKKLLPLLLLFFIQPVHAELSCSIESCGSFSKCETRPCRAQPITDRFQTATFAYDCQAYSEAGDYWLNLGGFICYGECDEEGYVVDPMTGQCVPPDNDDGGGECPQEDMTDAQQEDFHYDAGQLAANGITNAFDQGFNAIPSAYCDGGCQKQASGVGVQAYADDGSVTGTQSYFTTGSSCEASELSTLQMLAKIEASQNSIVNTETGAKITTEQWEADTSKEGNCITSSSGQSACMPLIESKATDSKGRDLLAAPVEMAQNTITNAQGQTLSLADAKPIAEIKWSGGAGGGVGGATGGSSGSGSASGVPTVNIYNSSVSSFPAKEGDFDNPADQGQDGTLGEVIGGGDGSGSDNGTTGDGLARIFHHTP